MPVPIAPLPTIQGGLQLRKLAALKPTVADKAHFNLSQFSAIKTVDPSQWKECDLSVTYKSPIRDQGTHGSCTGHAGVTTLDFVRRQMGQTPVLLSCTFPYSLVNGGRDNGASVSSILKVLEQVGTCTFEECGTDQIFQNQYLQSCFETAKKYQVIKAFMCNTFEELCEAVNQGYPVAFGIQVGNNFNQLSAEGVCPPPIMTIGGHALCGIGLKKSRTGTWLLKFQNSWTAQWGLGGYAYLSRGSFDNMVDGYAIMYAEDLDGPPVVKSLKITPKLLSPTPMQAAIEGMKLEEDKKVFDTINASAADQSDITIVPKENSLIAEIEGTSSDVHNDPEKIVDLPKDATRHKGKRK